MTRPISKDTRLCMSLAARPGNFGTRFHNHLYAALDLDYVYKAFTTTDLPAAIGGVRALGIRGCAVSMPFKEACILLVDELDPSAAAIGSVNTVVNTDGHLKAYNTDYLAVQQLASERGLSGVLTFALRGSGGMARAVAFALRDAGLTRGVLVARNEAAGRALAAEVGFGFQPELGGQRPDLLVNVTPVGMAGGPEAGELAFSAGAIAQAQVVFDAVALPAETPLILEARRQGKQVITGAEVAVLQALEQFVLYTGVRPGADQVQAAADYARQ
ncbi:shikimate 5-dehydrogenase [Deinococcus altitudinis]|uniref:shikimate 5-dehydrogenase n=1 Tax=Deinococcus altitudinis TaxID=468914 RepID=UPI0038925C9C